MMNIEINCVTLVVLICCVLQCRASSSQTTIVKHSLSHADDVSGFWNRKTTWKSRWMKHWQEKTIYVPVWKKVWTPVIQNEWVPLPKTPHGWNKKKTGDEWSQGVGRKSKSIEWSGSTYPHTTGWRSGSSDSSDWHSSGGSGGWKGITRTFAREVSFD